jgi:anti-sigma factor RsiW
MKNFTEEQLWNYIDGSCTEEERQQIEQALPENEALRLALAERLALHQALQKIEAEEPSMRFAANIMDKLQNIRMTVPQLVSPRVRRGFLLTMSTLSVAIVVLVFNLPESTSSSGAETTPYVSQWVEWTTTLVNSPITMIVACLGLSFLLLTFLDGYLKKRLVLKKTA